MIELDFTKLSRNKYAMSIDWDLELPFSSFLLSNLFEEGSENPLKNIGGLVIAKNGNVSHEALKEIIRLRCKTMTLPSTKVTAETLTIYGRTTRYITSAQPSESIQLSFLEGDKYELYKFFVAWRELTSSTAMAAPGTSREKAVMDRVRLMASLYNGNKNSHLEYILYGVQPLDASLSNFNDQSEMMTLTVTLKYDNYSIVGLPLKEKSAVSTPYKVVTDAGLGILKI